MKRTDAHGRQFPEQRISIAGEGVPDRVYRAHRKSGPVQQDRPVLRANLRCDLAKRCLTVAKVAVHKGDDRFSSHESHISR
ncbi:MAG: hypothetical protein R2853_17830 [Thermomicrobiales bacterium]